MISTAEMRRLENEAEKNGVTKHQLMERAGEGFAEALDTKYSVADKRILFVCYHGNNGGDGLVAARYLCKKAIVDILFIGDEHKLKDEAMTNYMLIVNNNAVNLFRADEPVDMNSYDFVVDALLGTGAAGDLNEPLATFVREMNDSSCTTVAVDVPTGVDPDSGRKASVCVDPDLIITFHDLKTGLKDYKDKAIIVDIGIPCATSRGKT